MKLKKIIELIQIKEKRKISYEEIGNILGIRGSAVGNRISRDSEMKFDEVKLLQNHYNLNLFENPDGNDCHHPVCLVDNKGFTNNKEIIGRINQFRNEKDITVDNFCEKMGMEPYLCSEYEEPANLSLRYIQKISEKFNISLDWLINGVDSAIANRNTMIADYYPNVFGSCGNGTFVLSEEKQQIIIDTSIIDKFSKIKKYSVINAVGDSMFPFIHDNDKLIVEHIECNDISDNHVYVFCYENRIYIKRLVFNINQLVVISDNPDKETYSTQYINKDNMNNVHIIGEIVGLMRNV